MSPECGGLTVHPQCVCVYLWGGGRVGSARDRAGPWDLWLVFGMTGTPGHPPPCLPWFTQMDFDTRGAGASRRLATAPPPGQTGPSPPTAPVNVAMPRNTQAARGRHVGQPPSLCRQRLASTAGPLTPHGRRGEELRLPRIQQPLAFLLLLERPEGNKAHACGLT